MAKIHPELYWTVSTVAALLFVFLIMSTITVHGGNRLETLGDTVKKIMNSDMKINNEAQLEQLMECIHQGTRGCDRIERSEGKWDKLEGTLMEGCPCGGEGFDGASFKVHFTFNETDKIELTKGEKFGSYDKVSGWESSTWNVISTSTCKENPLLQDKGPGDFLTPGSIKNNPNLPDVLFLNGVDGMTIHNNSRAIVTPDKLYDGESPKLPVLAGLGGTAGGVYAGILIGSAFLGPLGTAAVAIGMGVAGGAGATFGGHKMNEVTRNSEFSEVNARTVCIDIIRSKEDIKDESG